MKKYNFNQLVGPLSSVLAMVPSEPIIEGVLTEESLAMIYGPSGKGKTFLTLEKLLSVSSGKPFLGKFAVKQGNVLYCYGEGGAGLSIRIQAWLKKNEVEPEDCKFFATNWVINLANRNEVEEFIDVLKEYPDYVSDLKIICFDTLARCSVGAEENSNTQMGIVIDNADLIREKLGVTVLIVHHTGKNENNGERGASSIRGAMDTIFELKGEGTRSFVEMSMTKQKDEEVMDDLVIKFDTVELDNGKSSIVPYLFDLSQFKPVNDNLSDKGRDMYELLKSYGDAGVHDKELREVWKGTDHGRRSSNYSEARDLLLKRKLMAFDGDGFAYAIDPDAPNKWEDERTEQAL